MNETFRSKNELKFITFVGAAIHLFVLIGCSYLFFLDDPAGQDFNGPNSVAFTGGMGLVVFGTLFGISIYAAIDSRSESLTIDGTLLTVRTLKGLRHFDLSNLRRLDWRVRPRAGAILFHLPDFQVQQRLLNYSDDDGLKIIRALREMVPEETQEGWQQICYKIALPLRDGISAFARAQPQLALYAITRGQYDRKFLIVFPISLVMAVALGVWTNIWELCSLPVLVTGWWLIARFSIPPGGQCEVLLTSTSAGRMVLIALGLLLVALILMQGLAVYGVDKDSACRVAILVLLPAFPLIIYAAYKDQKLMHAAESAGRELASIEWKRSPERSTSDSQLGSMREKPHAI